MSLDPPPPLYLTSAVVMYILDLVASAEPRNLPPVFTGTAHTSDCDSVVTQKGEESVWWASDEESERLPQRRQEEAEESLEEEEEWQQQQQEERGEDPGHDLQQSCPHPDVIEVMRRTTVSFSDDEGGIRGSRRSRLTDRLRRPIVAPQHRKDMRPSAGPSGGASPGPSGPENSSLIRGVLKRQTGRSSRRKALSAKSLKALEGGLREAPSSSATAAGATGSGVCDEAPGEAAGEQHEAHHEGVVVALVDAASGAGLVLMLAGALVLLGAALEANSVIDAGILQVILTQLPGKQS